MDVKLQGWCGCWCGGGVAATLLDKCLSVFFPLYSFAGWTVYHPTSERGAYKSSSKPRARFLSGPVSVSICLYLFFCIFPPPGPWFLPLPNWSSLPLMHFIGCHSNPLKSPPPCKRWTPQAFPTAHSVRSHPAADSCVRALGCAQAPKSCATAYLPLPPHIYQGALHPPITSFLFCSLDVGRSFLFCCNCGQHTCLLSPSFSDNKKTTPTFSRYPVCYIPGLPLIKP